MATLFFDKSTTPVTAESQRRGVSFLPTEVNEVPCRAFGVDKMCVLTSIKDGENELHLWQVNGPTFIAKCTSMLPKGQLPALCAPFIQLR